MCQKCNKIIRVIKERFRVAFHRLPFKRIPKIMIKILATECTKKINFFPPKDGISNYYSPRAIMHQEPLDYNKHCAVPFGTYVQAHNEPTFKNSQHTGALDCIYLRYVDNIQGGHHLLDLNTGQTIKRRTVTQVPITQSIIDLVHKLAEKDNISEGFKITNRNNMTLFDSSWIAGVDYVDEHEEESNEDLETTTMDNMDPNEIAEIHTEKDDINKESESNPDKSEPSSEEENDENEEDNNEANEDEHVNEEMRTKSGRLVKPPVKLNQVG
jgi:hypothetical protein